MDKLQLLDRYFNSFIYVESPREFFIGLAEYLEYADSVPEFDKITTDLYNKRLPLENEFSASQALVVKRLLGSKRRFFCLFKEAKG